MTALPRTATRAHSPHHLQSHPTHPRLDDQQPVTPLPPPWNGTPPGNYESAGNCTENGRTSICGSALGPHQRLKCPGRPPGPRPAQLTDKLHRMRGHRSVIDRLQQEAAEPPHAGLVELVTFLASAYTHRSWSASSHAGFSFSESTTKRGGATQATFPVALIPSQHATWICYRFQSRSRARSAADSDHRRSLSQPQRQHQTRATSQGAPKRNGRNHAHHGVPARITARSMRRFRGASNAPVPLIPRERSAQLLEPGGRILEHRQDRVPHGRRHRYRLRTPRDGIGDLFGGVERVCAAVSNEVATSWRAFSALTETP